MKICKKVNAHLSQMGCLEQNLYFLNSTFISNILLTLRLLSASIFPLYFFDDHSFCLILVFFEKIFILLLFCEHSNSIKKESFDEVIGKEKWGKNWEKRHIKSNKRMLK
jgi:hypothetical protein